MLNNSVRVLRFLAGWVFTLLMSMAACIAAVLFGPKRAWVWCRMPWAKGTLWIVGTRVQIDGAQYLRQPAVFVSNHQSLIDVVLMPAIVPRTIRFLAKKELGRVPFFGWILARGGAVMIDRKNPRRAMQSIQEGLRQLPSGWSLLVFPEGTRSKDGQLKAFKKGAFHLAIEAKLPMVPIGLEGARDIVPKDGWLLQPGTVYVTVGAPIDTSQWQAEHLDVHVRDVQDQVAVCIQRSKERKHTAKINPVATRHPSRAL